MPNDPGDNTQCHATLFINAGDGKGHIVLLAGHPPVIAGMGNGVDTVGQADIDSALVDIGDFASILTLDTAEIQVVLLFPETLLATA